MKCPKCGYQPPRGRPKQLDDRRIRSLANRGWSLARLADRFGVTRGAIQKALKRCPSLACVLVVFSLLGCGRGVGSPSAAAPACDVLSVLQFCMVTIETTACGPRVVRSEYDPSVCHGP